MRVAFALLFAATAAAQSPPQPAAQPSAAQPPGTQLPKVLRIVRQSIKPGKATAQEKAGAAFARLVARARYPANFLALSAVSGEPETWIVESHDSFESVENADAFVEKNSALKWWVGQNEAQEADAVQRTRRLLAVYRQDMSYRGDQLAANLPKMRYMSIVMVRLHPARDADFAEIVRMVAGAYEKSASDQPLVIYQVVSGAPGPTYLFLSPMISLKTMDEAPLRGKAIREAMGEDNAAKMLKTSAEVTALSESFLFAMNPRLSYVSKEFAERDPDFWPRPAPRPVAPAPGMPGAPPVQPPVPRP